MAVAARGAVREAVVRATSFAQLLAQLRVHRELDHAPANLGELTVVVERREAARRAAGGPAARDEVVRLLRVYSPWRLVPSMIPSSHMPRL